MEVRLFITAALLMKHRWRIKRVSFRVEVDNACVQRLISGNFRVCCRTQPNVHHLNLGAGLELYILWYRVHSMTD